MLTGLAMALTQAITVGFFWRSPVRKNGDDKTVAVLIGDGADRRDGFLLNIPNGVSYVLRVTVFS
jgi:hypothetical protein